MAPLSQFFSVQQLKALTPKGIDILRDAIQNYVQTSPDVYALVNVFAQVTYQEVLPGNPVAPEEPDPP